MEKILIKASIICEGEKGARYLQKVLQMVFESAIEEKFATEISKVVDFAEYAKSRGNTPYSHGIQGDFLQRVITALFYPGPDILLLNHQKAILLAQKINNIYLKDTPVNFTFDILNRKFRLALAKETDSKEDLIEMFFYEEEGGAIDLNLQKILRDKLDIALG